MRLCICYVWCLSSTVYSNLVNQRFITLIDELYEAGCRLACSAVDVPDNLFVGTPNTKGDDDKITIDDIGSSGNIHGHLASVKELSFAFKRAASRLIEMTSSTWWEDRSVAIKE